MLQYIRRSAVPLTLALALATVGCSGDADSDQLAADSALSRDLQLAQGDSASLPALTDVPPAQAETPPAATPAPTRPRPTTPAPTRPRPTTPAPSEPAPAPVTESGNTVTKGEKGSEPTTGTIAAGTAVTLASASKVCTNTHKVGDRFTANVANAITGSNGATIPAGATAVLQVTSVKSSENVRDDIVIGLSVVSISFNGTSYAVNGSGVSADVERVRTSGTKDDAKKVAAGAIIGAIAGQVIGKDTKGTVIGAAAGAAAGGAAAAATGDYAGCINDGARISFKLDQPLDVKIAS